MTVFNFLYIRDIRSIIPLFVLQRTDGVVDRQRLWMYFYLSAAFILGIPLALAGLIGPPDDIFNYMLGLLLFLVVVLLVLFFFKRLSIYATTICLFLIIQAELSAEMIYCAFTPTEYNLMLILGNVVLAAMLMLLSMVAHLHYLPPTLGLITILTYIGCIRITENESLINFLPVFIIAFCILSILGDHLIKNLRFLEKENDTLRKEEQQLLEIFDINKGKIMAYVDLARGKDLSENKIRKLFRVIGEKQQNNIINTTLHYISMQGDEIDMLERTFPNLSTSELKICHLILQNKKLATICQLLDKTTGNVTSQRTHIRRKLGLKPKENLKQALQKKINELK